LLHDNARPHMANQTVKRVNKMGCEQMEHPPRSPDLTPQRFPYVWPNKRSSKRKKNFIRWRIHWRGAKFVRDTTKTTFFFWVKTCETLEPVHWSWRGLRQNVILDSFLYIYNKCAFLKSPFTFWLTLVIS